MIVAALGALFVGMQLLVKVITFVGIDQLDTSGRCEGVITRLPLHEPYRDYFASGALIVIGLLLTSGTFKCISYAVYRNKVLFILIALGFQTGGVASFLYVIGFFAPLSH